MAPDFGFSRGYVNRPFGMPEIDTQSAHQLFSDLAPLVNSMKNDDLFRQKQLMEFEESLRRRSQPQEMVLPTRGPNAVKKQHIVNYAPPTAMQQKFAQEEAEARDNKFRVGQINAQQQGRLQEALASGAQRNEGEMARLTAELNARASEGKATRTSEEKIAADKLAAESAEKKTDREYRSKEAQDARNDKGWIPTTIDDPNNPGQKITARMNAATGEVEPLTIKGKGVTGAQKLGAPGTKAIAGQPAPDQMAGIRETTQSVLDELDQMLDPSGKLQSHMKAATGKSNIPGTMLDKLGLGALAPETKLGKTAINTFKSKLIIDLIGKMKAQSKTGATGFGQMNMKELGVLESAIGKLDPDMPDDDFAAELNKIRDRLRRVMIDPKEAAPSGGGSKPKTPEEYMRKYGGGA
jgi:hypothetical protein